MLAGHIDTLTSPGFVEGWAYDRAAPARPVTVSVQDPAGHEIAWGLAHRYREDLAQAQIGTGWCAFQLRVSGPVGRLRKVALSLLDRASQTEIHRADPALFCEDSERLLSNVSDVTRSDPTMISAVEQLRGCADLFERFIQQSGCDMFVRIAYVYVLGRSADPSGLDLYGGLLRTARLSPYNLLVTLYNSDEFRSRPRLLGAPNSLAFPFAAV